MAPVARYRFLTTWLLDAPVEPVWDAIYDTDAWPSWWPGVRRVEELVTRGEDGVGGVSRFTFRSVLPYDLVFEMRSVRVERPRLLEGIASGELAGVGRWRFFAQDGVTAAIPGARNVSQSRSNAEAVNVVLPDGFDATVHDIYDRHLREAIHSRW